ncbi:MAG TPA: hypothetical protein VGE07_25420, partial [Herpetosiphonaceae bacterium]
MHKSAKYLVSLPERAVRASAAAIGGLVFETANVLLPVSVRQTKLYQSTLDRLLRIVVELVGDVPNPAAEGAMPAGELAARKLAGNVVETTGFVAFGWSPLWMLAAISDLSGGTRAYLAALVGELQRSGVLDANADIASIDALLQTLEESSGVAADAIDVPPLSAAALRQSWDGLRASTANLPEPGALAATFNELNQAAEMEGRTLLEVSAAIGAGAVRAGWQLGNAHVVDYYRESLKSINEEGLVAFLRRITTPYLSRAARHFDPAEPTYTEGWLDQVDPPAP